MDDDVSNSKLQGCDIYQIVNYKVTIYIKSELQGDDMYLTVNYMI